MRVSQIHQTNRRPSIHRVLLVSVLLVSHTHTHIYIYVYVFDRCLSGNQHRKFAYFLMQLHSNHSHRPQCRYITGPQAIYIFIHI